MGDVPNIMDLTDILGCKVGPLPMTPLGLHLGSSFRVGGISNPILEKVERLLTGWKLYLSKGGRVNLNKSTLSSIPTFLSLFMMPGHVANKLKKLLRDLLWGSTSDTKYFHLVDWRVVCSPLK